MPVIGGYAPVSEAWLEIGRAPLVRLCGEGLEDDAGRTVMGYLGGRRVKALDLKAHQAMVVIPKESCSALPGACRRIRGSELFAPPGWVSIACLVIV